MAESDDPRPVDPAGDGPDDALRFVVPPETYHRLPRNGAYRQEYIGGEVVIGLRPTYRYARLPTTAAPGAGDSVDAGLVPGPFDNLRVRALIASDREPLARCLEAAFERLPPFVALSADRRAETARAAIDDTLDGREGPLLESACSVIARGDGKPIGGCLVARPGEGWFALDSMRHQPHLNWIFVAPMATRHGYGRAMLRYALGALHDDGEPTLYSTFTTGNDASLLWHWEFGFELLDNPGSLRTLRKGLR